MAATAGVATERSCDERQGHPRPQLSRPICADTVVIQHSPVTFYHGPPTRHIMSWQL